MAEEVFKSFHDYQSKYKPFLDKKPDVTFDEKNWFKYELFRGELDFPRKAPNEKTLKKCPFMIKKIVVHDKDRFAELKNFIIQVMEFQKSVKVPAFLKVFEVCDNSENYTIILTQKDHKKTLADQHTEEEFISHEIEILSLLRAITKFYYQMKQEDIFEAFVNFNYPLKHLCPEIIYLYEKKNKNFPDAVDDLRVVMKVDMLMFEKNQNGEKFDKTMFHLNELKSLVVKYLKNNKLKQIGTCSKNLCRKLHDEAGIKWRDPHSSSFQGRL